MGKRRKSSEISYGSIFKIANDKNSKIHFVGVGGVSMYSLAKLTMSVGARVSGSDISENNRTQDLLLSGAEIYLGHSAKNARDASLLVYSHAISPDNEELKYAEKSGIPWVSRADYLGAMMLEYHERIGVSGSHGKSTTVAMLECIFSLAKTNPTVLCGAEFPGGFPIRLGSKGTLIYESCEYKDSFLRFSPTISLGLNLELDHTDYFKDIEAIKASFARALGKAEKLAIINGDDENLVGIIKDIKCPIKTFGGGERNDYRYFITSFSDLGFEFSVLRYGTSLGNFKLNIPGAFNVHNACAAIAVAMECGIEKSIIHDAVSLYRGISGRLEYIGSRFSRPVYYDYAHHPTEIAASINALKMQIRGPLTVVFKPHTFTRTAALWEDFCRSLALADYLIITDIFPAREKPIDGITSERLASEIGKGAVYCTDDDVTEMIDRQTEGAVVLMGAGNFEKIKSRILER